MAAQTLNKKKNLNAVRDGFIIAVLLVLMLIVLMPMLWMILTALKTRGTAFQMDIIPRTTLYDPPRSEEPISNVPDLRTAKCLLHVEYEDMQATSVAAIIATVGDKDLPTSHTLNRSIRGIWWGSIPCGDLDDRNVRLSFLVNEAEEVPYPDPERYDEGFNLERGMNVTIEPRVQLVFTEGNRLRTRYSGLLEDETASLIAYQNGREIRRLPLTLSHDGIHAAEPSFSDIEDLSFRFAITRSFRTAVGEKYTLENFRTILTSRDFNFGRYFLNSLVVATSAGLLTVLICTLAGYAFAQLNFHFRDGLFGLLLASMLVPGMIFMVPQFSITLRLGLMDSYAGMVVPHLANVFGLFLLRQYIGQIPRDLFAAAEIDGARQYQIFQTIVIPICLPIMVTLFLLVFVGQWSNFLWQLIINTGASQVLTLPVGLQQFKGQNANEWEMIMAGACFSIIPIAVLFLSLQRYFLQGLTAGAVKE